jgi:hypothetical protein
VTSISISLIFCKHITGRHNHSLILVSNLLIPLVTCLPDPFPSLFLFVFSGTNPPSRSRSLKEPNLHLLQSFLKVGGL